MPLPKLSLLQSRLAASLIALITLLMLYFTFSLPHFAYAADVDSIRSEDHNHERLLDSYILDKTLQDVELRDVGYEADFLGSDRGIIGRVDPEVKELTNNVPLAMNVVQGATVNWYFPNASVFGQKSPPNVGLPSPVRVRRRSEEGSEYETLVSGENDWWLEGHELGEEAIEEFRLRPRQSVSEDSPTVYITVNVCLQPVPQDPALGSAPQLILYVSQSQNNTTPGPGQDPNSQQEVTLDGGAAGITLNATGDVFIGVSAPNMTTSALYSGPYSAEVAASIDAPYHYYDSSDPNLFLIDSDSVSALLITNNLTTAPVNSTVYQEWMNLVPPFVMFAGNHNDTTILGIQNSYCGLETYANIAATKDGKSTNLVQIGMTTRGLGNLPKQQFYFSGLNSSSSYYGILAMNGNSTDIGAGVVGGGGRVWQAMNFTTLSDGNCDVIFNLTFCNQTAYAVPGNKNNFANTTALAAFYDNAAQAQYQLFQNVLAQIPCETTSSAQYSLVRTCDDCAAAYKEWLCSVTIPRCTDFSSDLPWLQERNIAQAYPNGTLLDLAVVSQAAQSAFLSSSRNPNIDLYIQPGPYKEVLPCDDLCYNIVQSCPASMSFACPMPGYTGFNQSYGRRPDSSQFGQITCNYPGAAYYFGAGSKESTPHLLKLVTVALLGLVFV